MPSSQVRFPNLDFGHEAPDFIIVGENKSDDITLRDQAIRTNRDRIIHNLFDGRLGYTLVATFKTPTMVPIRSLPVNPSLYIFERTMDRAAQEDTTRVGASSRFRITSTAGSTGLLGP